MGQYVVFADLGSSWWETTLKVVLVLIGLNLVILVHEFGHFIVARWCGVKCEKFYIWFDVFGLKLFKVTRGDTEYGIGVLPLGGYVKMLGQEDNPARLKEEIERAKAQSGQPSGELAAQIHSAERALYDPRSYLAKSVPQRMAIISAGVAMNVVFALVAAVFAYGLGVEHVKCAVGAVFPGEAAWRANVRVGDEIEQIAGRPVERFSDLQRAVAVGNIDRGVTMVLRRPRPDGSWERLTVTVHPDRTRLAPSIGIISSQAPVLAEPFAVVPGSPAGRATPPFRPGDRIVRIGDVAITGYAPIHSQLALHPGEPLEIVVQRTESPSDAEPGTPREIVVEVAPNPMRRLGLAMQIGPVVAIQDDSPAARAGVEQGDRIVAVDGERPGDPLTLPDRMRERAEQGRPVRLTIERAGEPEPLEIELPPRRVDWYGMPAPVAPAGPMSVPALGLALEVSNQVAEIAEGSPADKAGIRPGDVVASATLLRADPALLARYAVSEENADEFQRPEITLALERGQANWPVVIWVLQESLPGTRVQLRMKDGRELTLDPEVSDRWFHPERGFKFEALAFTQTARSVPEALALGTRETWDSLTLIFRTLGSLGTGQVSFRGLAGPVGIFHLALDSAGRGLASLAIFLCLISANLAVLNFIPIPVLDGGHMVFLGYEGIRGKPPSENVLTTLSFAGLVLLLTLMLWVTGLDIFRIFGS